MKNDPTTMSGMKNAQLNMFPIASLVCKGTTVIFQFKSKQMAMVTSNCYEEVGYDEDMISG